MTIARGKTYTSAIGGLLIMHSHNMQGYYVLDTAYAKAIAI